jgi:hypothetical protein
MKKNLINEVRQLQKIAGILKEDQSQIPRLDTDPGGENWPEERLESMLKNNPEALDLSLKFLRFVEELYPEVIGDELILKAISYSALQKDPNELLSIMADTIGEGSDDPDPFDGVFAYSDIENAAKYSGLPQDIADLITDDDRIRNLELG